MHPCTLLWLITENNACILILSVKLWGISWASCVMITQLIQFSFLVARLSWQLSWSVVRMTLSSWCSSNYCRLLTVSWLITVGYCLQRHNRAGCGFFCAIQSCDNQIAMLHGLVLQVKVAEKLGVVYQLHRGSICKGITLHATTSRQDTGQVRQAFYIFAEGLVQPTSSSVVHCSLTEAYMFICNSCPACT